MSRRDYGPAGSFVPDQPSLRLVYEGTTIEQIVRLLREVYLNILTARIQPASNINGPNASQLDD